MNSIELDNISREKIRNNINCNYFVEAGAGSGKTSILVERMLAMVESGIDISKICAITFTKAAAGEFFERFQKKLSESTSPHAQKALKNIDLCFMGTIDSFCNLILSEHPVEAHIPSSSSVIDKDEMNVNYIKIFGEIAAGEHGSELQKKCWTFKKYVGFSENVFVNGLNVLMPTRNAKLQYKKIADAKFQDLYSKQINIVLQTVKYLQEHPEIAYLGDAKSRTAWKSLQEEASILFENWDDNFYIINSVLKKLKSIRLIKEFDIKNLGLNYDKIFEPHPSLEKNKFWEIRSDCDALLLETIENFQFEIALDFIHDATNIVANLLRKQGKLSFFDYLMYLRDMLKDDASKQGKLIEHIYNRHSYFLIDEFQDTNPIQSEIFFYLSAQNPVEDWTQCVPKPGSLFVVGDPKQSIYRFRNADVAAFNRVKNLFTGKVGEVLVLTQNFRSTKTICEYFNNIFSVLLPHITDNQSKFLEIPLSEKLDDKSNLQGAYKFTYNNKDRNLAPSQIAQIIADIVSDKDRCLFDHQNNKYFHPEFSDFMIITPTKPRLLEYMNAFVQLGLPFAVEGQTLFNDCPSLEAIARILKALAFPQNNDAIFSATKLSGIALKREDIFMLSQTTKLIPTSAIFTELIDNLKIVAKCGTHNLEYMYYALELLKNKEASGDVLSAQEASAFIDNLVFGDSKDIERCIQLSTNNNRIRLANLHKVKGLEAPIVFLAGPSKRAKVAEYRLDYSDKIPKSFIFSLNYGAEDWASKPCIKSLSNTEEKEMEAQVLAAEEIRLLYVAATRARNVLIVSNPLDNKGQPTTSNPWAPLLSQIDDEIELPQELINPQTEKLDANKLIDKAKTLCVLNNRDSENASYQIYRPSETKILKTSTDDDTPKDNTNVDQSTYNAALLGTIVHRLLELLVNSNFKIDVKNAIVQISDEYNLTDKFYTNILDNVVPQISALVDKLQNAVKTYCEFPFCYMKKDGTISNGVIDLIFKDTYGWHIIDYKTNVDSSNLEEKYASQLQEYIDAFEYVTGNTADAKIFHIQHG